MVFVSVRFGVGFGLAGDGTTFLDANLPEGGRYALWNGYGGSVMLMDFERHLTFAFTMNKMKNEAPFTETVQSYLTAIYKALGVEGSDKA